MNYKHKKMLFWDLKELDSFSPQSLTVEPFNMWPSGNCGHIYSSTQTQARRHISGWAMRNTNNHNINILKKSCLGVLVCNHGCRRSDSSVVAVRPAICDKARRKQIGRKCPNECGGVLVMQQCKGHSSYPVTHFWRHHEDKVFFLGKGHHDHPRPELKLCAEKRKAYIRVSSRRTDSVSCLTKPRATRVDHRHQMVKNRLPGAGAYSANVSQTYQPQPSSLPYYSNPLPYSYTTQVFRNQPITIPDCDFYIPPIGQELSFSSANQPPPVYAPNLAQITEVPNIYQMAQNSTAPINHSTNPFPCTSSGFSSRPHAASHGYTDTAPILDLSMPSAPLSLDISWQSDPPSFSRTANSYYNKSDYQTSAMPIGNEIVERSVFETSKVSTFTEKTYETRIHERKEKNPFRLHALWDSMYPAEQAETVTSVPLYRPPIAVHSASSSTELPNGVPLTDVLNFDDLDMSDISNILTIPSEVTKPTKMETVGRASSSQQYNTINQKSSSRYAENLSNQFAGTSSQRVPGFTDKSSVHLGVLPNLSSFLQDIEYL